MVMAQRIGLVYSTLVVILQIEVQGLVVSMSVVVQRVQVSRLRVLHFVLFFVQYHLYYFYC
jgi:hypothetical protein